MANNITLEFCPEDRARLDRISEGLRYLADKLVGMAVAEAVQAGQDKARAAATEEPKPNPPAEPEPAVAVPEQPAEPMREWTYAEMLQRARERMKEDPSMEGKVQKLLQEYAKKLSAIPMDKRPEFMARLEDLEVSA